MNKQMIFTGWHFMRWLRLGLGIVIAFQAIQSHDALLGLISGLFLFQTITNTGCCGAKGCDASTTKKTSGETEDVTFEEIKTK